MYSPLHVHAYVIHDVTSFFCPHSHKQTVPLGNKTRLHYISPHKGIHIHNTQRSSVIIGIEQAPKTQSILNLNPDFFPSKMTALNVTVVPSRIQCYGSNPSQGSLCFSENKDTSCSVDSLFECLYSSRCEYCIHAVNIFLE